MLPSTLHYQLNPVPREAAPGTWPTKLTWNCVCVLLVGLLQKLGCKTRNLIFCSLLLLKRRNLVTRHLAWPRRPTRVSCQIPLQLRAGPWSSIELNLSFHTETVLECRVVVLRNWEETSWQQVWGLKLGKFWLCLHTWTSDVRTLTCLGGWVWEEVFNESLFSNFCFDESLSCKLHLIA